MNSSARRCPSCGTAAGPDDLFCGDCGAKLLVGPVAQVSRPPGSPAGETPPSAPKSRRKWLIRGLVLTGALAAVWFLFLRAEPYTPPTRNEPQLPQPVAGTMREFPIDTGVTDPARLTSAVSQNFSSSESTTNVSVPAAHLPPGMSPADLPRYGTAVTSGQYRTAGATDPVNVQAIATRGNPTAAGQQITRAVAEATGGDRTGIEVASPQGGTYRGERIRTMQVVIYVLVSQYGSTVIIVYAPTPAVQPVAERLAGNVGNGRGIMDQPGMQNVLWTLPRTLPPGFVLEGTMVATPSDLGLDPDTLSSGGPAGIDPEIRQFMGAMEELLPERFVSASYRGPAGAEWGVLVCDFDSISKAQNLWRLLNWTVGFQMVGVQVGTVAGLTVETDDGQILLFQRGPYVVAVVAPPDTTMELILVFAGSLQI